MSHVRLLGYDVYDAGRDACAEEIVGWIGSGGRCRWMACLNPHSHVVAAGRPSFAGALHAADWLVPDGVGISLAARVLGVPLHQRVTGSDVFEGVTRRLDAWGRGRVYFLGASPETLTAIERRHRIEYPNVRVVGTHSPPFKAAFSEAELQEMANLVNEARPDVLWVGMTAPKQEEWIHALVSKLDVRFAGAIGAVFDFYSGRVRRSSVAAQRLGLEWLPRLLREPRRLWRRNLNSFVFLIEVVRAAVHARTE